MDLNQPHPELQKMIAYIAEHSPFYGALFQRSGIDPRSIVSIQDLQKLPFTTKEDLQQQSSDFLCVPPHLLIDYVTTSGTTGQPVTLALTNKDLDRLSLNEYASFKTAGLTEYDIIQLMTTMDRRFMAGMAYFLGARKLGAGIIRVGNGLPELQWDTILKIKPSVILCVPSFLVKLIEFAEDHGIDHKNTSVKKAICIGEAIRNPDFSLNALGRRISEKWDIGLHSTYASSEMAAAFTECEAGNGGHLQPDLLVAELIDEEGATVKEGQAGELVITTLGVEGMPLLRFKTGDMCMAHTSPCACGRKSLRLGPILGRKKQMIKYKGTSLYPQALYDILETIDRIKNYQIEVSHNELGTDEITIHMGLETTSQALHADLEDLFRSKLRVVPRLNFLSPDEITRLLLPESSRKPLKFIDKRISTLNIKL